MTKFCRTFPRILLFVIVCACLATCQQFASIVSFEGANGFAPMHVGLMQGPDGHLYGTTYSGGTDNGGVIFRLSTEGILSTPHSFVFFKDGIHPNAWLLLATDGNLYGMTAFGGLKDANACPSGCGTIFRISPNGIVTTLYTFCSQANCADGANPDAGLIQATDGDFYGTTPSPSTVFRISPNGVLTTLNTFNDGTGVSPVGGVIQGSDGNFYGVTEGAYLGFGSVYKMTPDGTRTTLHYFSDPDGAYPVAGLVQGADGSFYGTTTSYGPNCPPPSLTCVGGTIYRITAAGSFTTLYGFCGQAHCADGQYPQAALIQGTDGDLYGTTFGGGLSGCPSYGCGTVFKITTTGQFTTLHRFDGYHGLNPVGSLLQGTDGTFYGTTELGGDLNCNDPWGCGSIFRLSTGLAPFVALVSDSGAIGQTVGILGQEFAGTTEVSFGGISAPFAVVSNTYITATVPFGATNGYVTVTTPTGTLTSNKPFVVIP